MHIYLLDQRLNALQSCVSCTNMQVKRVNGHENVILDALELCMQHLDKAYHVTPEDHFRLIRVLPYYMLMCDGEGDDAKSFNMFKTSKIKLASIQKIFKKYPVVPLYGDINMVLEIVLHRSLHYDTVKMGRDWGSALNRYAMYLFCIKVG